MSHSPRPPGMWQSFGHRKRSSSNNFLRDWAAERKKLHADAAKQSQLPFDPSPKQPMLSFFSSLGDFE
jgi:hypothetical protein